MMLVVSIALKEAPLVRRLRLPNAKKEDKNKLILYTVCEKRMFFLLLVPTLYTLSALRRKNNI